MITGVIGGSGLYEMEGFALRERRSLTTPFGEPSDEYACGSLGGREVVFLPRHGRGHRLLPSEINHRGNIFGLKQLGVSRIISVTAVGSLCEEFRPGDIVLPDQYFDRTKRSEEHTFFGAGLVAHIPFGEPTCAVLRKHLLTAAKHAAARVHDGATYVNMEGPAFSTRAESEFYRTAGFGVIGMTSLAEAKLAREAGICYAAIAMVTDYDCWHETAEHVSAETVLQTVKANIRCARDLLTKAMATLPEKRTCACARALDGAVMTAADSIPSELRQRLQVLRGTPGN